MTAAAHRPLVAPARHRSYLGKRALDLLLLLAVAVPVLLVGLLCATAIKLSSPGPVFFRQLRVGRDGRPFRIWKFRTMVDDDNPVIPDDERITSVGRLLRRTSLDELPQLLNVARGEMSVVGPRPTLGYQVERWTPRQRDRLLERPGLTGLAQVSGRNALTWSERIEHDLAYIERQSLWLDLRILARTCTTVMTGRGTEATAADDPLAQLVEV